MIESAQPKKLNLNTAPTRSAFTGMNTPNSTVTPAQTQATPALAPQPIQVQKPDSVLHTMYPPKQTQTPVTLLKKKKNIFSRWWFRVLLLVILLLAIVGAVAGYVGFYTYKVAMELKVQSDETKVLAKSAYDQFKAQNLPGAQKGFAEVKAKVADIRQTYKKLEFYNSLPIARAYYQDGIHGLNAADAGIDAGTKSLAAVSPYADVLGFTGQGTFSGGTAEDRLKLILQTLSKVTPQLDSIAVDLEKVKAEVGAVDPNRYPETFQGHPVRASIVQARDLSAGAATALTEFRPVIEQIPYVAGADGKRKKYFVLFQNDKELRPTGGFMTAYAVIFVENGKVTPEKSDDIYQLDKKFNKNIPIPAILGKYLTSEKYFNIRDMNISPDFKESMDQFLANYKLLPGEPKDIDGIIAIDTSVLVDILKITGPIDVPGYEGKFSAENTPKCDCPQIIYELSNIITRPTPYIRPAPKGILAPMMNTLLQRAYTAPKNKWPDLFQAAWKNVEGRHVQFYLFDQKAQAAVDKVNAGGRLTLDPTAQDFLAVVDANLGGAKSNLFITSTIDQEVSTPANGEITKKVTVTYRNSRHGDNCNLEAGLLCLNARLRDWNRIYLPKGSKLKNAQGYREGSLKTSDQGAFTVVEGEFLLDPLSQAKLQFEYTVPYTDKDYKVKLWKQGGVDAVPVNFDVNGNQDKVLMDKDIVFTSKF